MLEMLHLKNVGPAPEMKLEFAPRLNVITGDNGLGKSFILDCAWFSITHLWSQEVNSKLTVGGIARPTEDLKSQIIVSYSQTQQEQTYRFDLQEQDWVARVPGLQYHGVVIQTHTNGGFSVWDSIRNRLQLINLTVPPSVFTESEVWNGLNHNSALISEGLIRDVANWQRENGKTFKQFQAVLECLSPSKHEQLRLGELTRVRLENRFDTPTIQMPYGKSIPITQASSGIRRIFAFAYILVWAWSEYQLASQILKQEPQNQLTFLIDEIESHLHPKWQQVIAQALLNVAKALSDELEVQIILTTHSPIVMASLEPIFDPKKDAWFDLNLVNNKVTLEKMPWNRRGGADNWLLSEAFDLTTTGSRQRETAIEEAARVLDAEKPSKKKFLEVDKKLRSVLSETDDFWVRWHFIGSKKGWL
jgi:AAA domain, putative AbiEii toxin, Type IV TA system